MKCPTDGADLVMAERQGIEIDYCPKCRGVWLDRGELDKIIERSGAASTQSSFLQPRQDAGPQQDHYQPSHGHQHYDRHHHEDYERHHQGKYDPRYGKRKSSFLGDLFEFGD
jgi:Zn-finger nucleic acid-binding protein